MENFTPLSALVGGALIGLAATLLLWLSGRIAGISGIVKGLLPPQAGDTAWRFIFIVGLIAGAGLWWTVAPGTHAVRQGFPLWLLGVAGLVVGFGTAMGSGCTSGHGVCGLGRLSVRSLVATIAFMLTGVATVYVVRHLIGG